MIKLTTLLVALLSGASRIAAAQSITQEQAGSVMLQSAAIQAGKEDARSPERWAIHGQLTNVTQSHPRFTSPYSGTNSLQPNGRTEETTDITLYTGMRLWRGAELWLNPEIDQGFGLNNTVGLAGFASGEAYKVGANTPYLRLSRAFIRQVLPLGGSEENIESAANQLSGSRAANNLILRSASFHLSMFSTRIPTRMIPEPTF